MELSYRLYILLIVGVAAGRLLELSYSRRNQERLMARGSHKVHEPGYRWMVLFHTCLLAGAVLETVLLQRPWIPLLGWTMLALFLAANAARWWVIRTLGTRWNVEVVSAPEFGVSTGGPYRWIRHPNYSAVFLEMLVLPLIHTAWITAAAGTIVHILVLRRRVRLEESVLLLDPAWSANFEKRPRFVPGWR